MGLTKPLTAVDREGVLAVLTELSSSDRVPSFRDSRFLTVEQCHEARERINSSITNGCALCHETSLSIQQHQRQDVLDG